jgi:hypothetical protein
MEPFTSLKMLSFPSSSPSSFPSESPSSFYSSFPWSFPSEAPSPFPSGSRSMGPTLSLDPSSGPRSVPSSIRKRFSQHGPDYDSFRCAYGLLETVIWAKLYPQQYSKRVSKHGSDFESFRCAYNLFKSFGRPVQCRFGPTICILHSNWNCSS